MKKFISVRPFREFYDIARNKNGAKVVNVRKIWNAVEIILKSCAHAANRALVAKICIDTAEKGSDRSKNRYWF